MRLILAMLTGSILLAATPALAAGDAAAGEAIFKAKCSICHTNVEGKNKIGPSLWAVVGRKAGSLPGYNYSDAMKNANRTWDATTLDAYLTNPRQNIPGVKMLFVGLPNADDRANVIAYLSTLK